MSFDFGGRFLSDFNEITVSNRGFVKGDYFPPPSKSHSFRALLLSLYSKSSIIKNLLKSEDVDNFVKIIKSLGFSIDKKNDVLFIKESRKLIIKENYNFKNSGTALRFMVTYFSNLKSYNQKLIIDGDNQLRKRKIKKLLISLHSLGLDYGFNTEKEIPFYITKNIKPGITHISGKSSQFLSSLLLSLSFLTEQSTVYIDELSEKPYVDMTLFHLKRVGVNIKNHNYKKMIINPIRKMEYFEFTVPSDFSSATYVILASVLSEGDINIHNLDLNDAQGDKKILHFLNKLGVEYTYNNNILNLIGNVKKSAVFDMADTPDMLPALVFFLVQYPYYYEFLNLESIRYKETDRVSVLYENLINMGINVEMTNSKLRFMGSDSLNNIKIDAHDDHRIIMGASLLGMKKNKRVKIVNVKNLGSSYPNYFSDIEMLGFFIECSS